MDININDVLEIISFYGIDILGSFIIIVIAMTKGLTTFFKVEQLITKQLIPLGITLWLVIALFIIEPIEHAINFSNMFQMANSILLVYFGSTGIYDLIPHPKLSSNDKDNNEEEIEEESEVI